jgi:hypothetical protein
MQYIDLFFDHYGWQGTDLAAIIILLFLVQMYYYIILYGRISRFRNAHRRKILDAEPPISVVIPIFSEDTNMGSHAVIFQMMENIFYLERMITL